MPQWKVKRVEPGLRRDLGSRWGPDKGGGSFARPSIASMPVGAQTAAAIGVGESKGALGVALCACALPGLPGAGLYVRIRSY